MAFSKQQQQQQQQQQKEIFKHIIIKTHTTIHYQLFIYLFTCYAFFPLFCLLIYNICFFSSVHSKERERVCVKKQAMTRSKLVGKQASFLNGKDQQHKADLSNGSTRSDDQSSTDSAATAPLTPTTALAINSSSSNGGSMILRNKFQSDIVNDSKQSRVSKERARGGEVSSHSSSSSSSSRVKYDYEMFEDTPLLQAIYTYICYAVLNLFGWMRDFMRRTGLEKRKGTSENNPPVIRVKQPKSNSIGIL